MYKIIENNQIIDVMETISFVKYLPNSKRSVLIDERQANGILSSDKSTIYHISGSKNVFPEGTKTVYYIKINKEEYDRLTTQLKENQQLSERVKELEKLVAELYNKII